MPLLAVRRKPYRRRRSSAVLTDLEGRVARRHRPRRGTAGNAGAVILSVSFPTRDQGSRVDPVEPFFGIDPPGRVLVVAEGPRQGTVIPKAFRAPALLQ